MKSFVGIFVIRLKEGRCINTGKTKEIQSLKITYRKLQMTITLGLKEMFMFLQLRTICQFCTFLQFHVIKLDMTHDDIICILLTYFIIIKFAHINACAHVDIHAQMNTQTE